MVSEEYIKAEYPLHWCVWKNDYKNLEKLLAKKTVSVVFNWIISCIHL